MEIDLAVVPVAGFGTRLLPATKSQPKEMLPVGRKPVVQHVIEELRQSGIRRILFVTGAGKTAIENHFDEDGELISRLRQAGKEDELAELDFERHHLDYFYTRQRRQLGLGHAILCAQPFVGNEPFVVALGDSIIGLHAQSDIARRMIALYRETDAKVVVAFEKVPAADVPRFGIAKPRRIIDGDVFELESIVEKPAVDEAASNLAIAGRYVCHPLIFDKLAQTRRGRGGEIQLTDAIQSLLQDGHKGLGVCLSGDERRFDIGDFESYFSAFVEFALADEKYGRSLRIYLERLLDKQGGR